MNDANAVGVCSVSHKRVLRTELRECPVSHEVALPEFFVSCPISGQLVLPGAMRECVHCRQRVGMDCVSERGFCGACQNMQPAGPSDPRLARVLGEHPGLGVWGRWRLAETRAVYILAGSALLYNEGVRNVAELTGLPLQQIVKATSWNQARSLGIEGFGKLEAGYHADIAILNDDFSVWKTLVGGEER